MKNPIKGVDDLATLYPGLAAEWDEEKNGDDSPSDYTCGSNAKRWWICAKGHSWCAFIYERAKRSRGCPYCAGHIPVKGVNDLATIRPDLAAEWNVERNEDDPSDYTCGSNIKKWWTCQKGHMWLATISDRASGKGCPYCSGRLPVKGVNDAATLNPELVAEWHPLKNGTDSLSNYTAGSGAKRWWKCREGHEWQAEIYNRTAGRGCPYCAGKRPVKGVTDAATICPELVAEWHPLKNGNDSLANYTAGSGAKRWWKCREGHEWQATILHRVRGKGCPVCNGRVPGIYSHNLLSDYPGVAAEWDYDRNDSLPEDYRPHSSKFAWWKCPEGHTWSARINEMTSARRLGSCPYCSGRRPVRGCSDLATMRPDLAAEWDYGNNRKGPEEYTVYSNQKVFWVCPEGHRYRAVIANRSKGKGCPICHRTRR